MKKTFIIALLFVHSSAYLLSQSMHQETSLLWKVTGNGMPKPSYLFGTYHFLSNAFVDTLKEVKDAYKNADVIVGELVIDSSIQAPLMEASILKGTTLKQVLPDSIYTRAANWFSKAANLDLAKLDQLNPLSVMTFAMAVTQQKYYPNNPGEIQLDTYFQQMAKRDGKKVIGLETIQAQIAAMYGQLTLNRQAALLNDAVKDEDRLKKLIGIMNKAYISQNLNELQALTYGTAYEEKEMKALLDDRNMAWMGQLPDLMNKQSLFVAVGALHLVGESGLVDQLRSKGYTVTAINLIK